MRRMICLNHNELVRLVLVPSFVPLTRHKGLYTDLSGTSFGQVGYEVDLLRRGEWPDYFAYLEHEFFHQRAFVILVVLEFTIVWWGRLVLRIKKKARREARRTV